MEVLFENKTVITKKVFAEFTQKTYKICSKKYRIFVFLASLASAFSAVVGMSSNELYWFSAFMFLVTAFFFLCFLEGIFFKKTEVLKTCKGYMKNFHLNQHIFFEENIKNTTLRSNLTLNYGQITNMIETETLYILLIGKQGIILKRDGFTVGDADSFKLFIKEKCKNI